MSQKRIMLTGGGTAGHITPNLALIPHLLADSWSVHYMGTADGMEQKLLQDQPFVTYHAVKSGKLRRYFSVKNFTDPVRVLQGISQAKRVLSTVKPDVVFAKGGFVSVPCVFAASSLSIPVVLHESDATPGLANRMCIKKANVLCTSFEMDASVGKGAKVVWTGSPIRESILQGDGQKVREQYHFDEKPVLFVTGGSQGSVAINQAVDDALSMLLPHYNVIHQRGEGNLNSALQQTPGYVQLAYIQEGLEDIFALASLVICRAGSNTLFELLALRKPMLLIPIPLSASRGDQIKNAQLFSGLGYAAVLPQENLYADSLVDAVEDTLRRAPQMIDVMEHSALRDGTGNVLREIYRTVRIPARK